MGCSFLQTNHEEFNVLSDFTLGGTSEISRNFHTVAVSSDGVVVLQCFDRDNMHCHSVLNCNVNSASNMGA